MEKYRAIPQGYMTAGEVAKKMNVTVRTLQHYDKENLLSPSAISDGGRRLYTDKDSIDDWRSDERYSVAYNALRENKNHFSFELARDILSGKHGFMCQYERKKGSDTVWAASLAAAAPQSLQAARAGWQRGYSAYMRRPLGSIE